ncbi:hypothetical protein TomTYG75_31450 [Sphingobium sp. TomTYG75]
MVGLNALSDAGSATGTVATVNLLNGDGTVVQATLPTTVAGVQQGLAPVGSLAGTLLGDQAGGTVTQLTDGLAPVVATVTSAATQVTAPVLDTLNGALAPITAPLVGSDGALAPVTGLVETVAGGLTGALGGGGEAPGALLGAPLIGANVGGEAVTGPSTSGTLAGVNLLPSTTAPAQGQLLTADVLTQGTIVDVTVPTTTTGVEAGLAPVGNLVGGVLGAQAGAAVNQVVTGAAPVVATVTSTVDSVASPVLDAVNGLAPALPAGGSGGGESLLAPVTGLLGGASAPSTGEQSPIAPVTGLLGGLLGR